ncbi:MAG TPA: 3'-5' exonuclease, partial [Verrucomicrobiota bacterium]|nr:3'-5' exonuclease [Verrucomicrobiota bacterium]
FVNDLFSKIMTVEKGKIEYDNEAVLIPGLEFDNDSINRVELNLLLKKKEESEDLSGDENNANGDKGGEEEDPTDIQKEAAMIAERLKSLKESKFKIKDKKSGEMRDVDWKHMVVLLRSPSTHSEIYVQEFNDRGIPLIIPCGDVFKAIEVQDIVNLLRLLDNPLQDLPLAAVLRSPLVGFTNKELTLIRVASKGGRLWTALNIFINSTQNIKNKIGESISIDTEEYQQVLEILNSAHRKAIGFIELFNKWRGLSRQVSLSHCIETIIDDTQYCIWCQAQVGGAQKHSNIQLLLEITRQFDPLQRQGLARFLRYIDANKEAEIEIEPASVEGENAVRLMSIHQSKGLEFPVVCIADTAKKFNLMDVYSDIILDDSLGICPKVHQGKYIQNYPSPIYWVARRRNLCELILEEIRLLYVAMTRARDMLLISGVAPSSMIEKLKDGIIDRRISPEAILKAKNYLQWICLWLWSYYKNKNEEWYDSEGGVANSLVWRKNKFDYSAASAQKQSAERSADEIKPQDSSKLEELEKRFSWVYPFINATKEPAKTSVSEIRRRIVDEDDSLKIFTPLIRKIILKPTEDQKKLPAVVRGEAYHKFLELIDYNKCATIDGVVNELNRLVAEGSISSDYAVAIVPEKIFNFWSSEIGKMFLSKIRNLRRELPFTIRMNSKESGLKIMLSDGTEDEFVVVQGVIDLCMISENEIWILDYKTDEMKPEEIETKNKEYAPQIELYAYSLKSIYNRPVTKKWLHYFSIDKTVAV